MDLITPGEGQLFWQISFLLSVIFKDPTMKMIYITNLPLELGAGPIIFFNVRKNTKSTYSS